MLVGEVQDGGFPLGKKWAWPGWSCRRQPIRWRVHPLHHFGGLQCLPAVFIGGLGADLPRPVHLVTQTPELNAVGLPVTVLLTQVAVVGAPRVVAVLHQVAGCIRSPGAQVHRHHQFGTHLLRPVGEFIYSHFVRLHGAPGQIQAARPQLFGPPRHLPSCSRIRSFHLDSESQTRSFPAPGT